jgi:hypothetical protein
MAAAPTVSPRRSPARAGFMRQAAVQIRERSAKRAFSGPRPGPKTRSVIRAGKASQSTDPRAARISALIPSAPSSTRRILSASERHSAHFSRCSSMDVLRASSRSPER